MCSQFTRLRASCKALHAVSWRVPAKERRCRYLPLQLTYALPTSSLPCPSPSMTCLQKSASTGSGRRTATPGEPGQGRRRLVRHQEADLDSLARVARSRAALRDRLPCPHPGLRYRPASLPQRGDGQRPAHAQLGRVPLAVRSRPRRLLPGAPGPARRTCPPRSFAYLRPDCEYYRYRYDADDGYVGVLTHNPVHPRYRRTSEWLREAPHKLVELAAPIPKHWRLPVKPTTAEGRNCLLFRYGMRWCGRPSNWEYIEGVGEVIAAANDALDVPLWESEVQGIAKSVIKISRRNLASGQTQQNFAFIQAARGRKSGEVRRRRTAERDAEIVRRVLAGESMRAVARAFGLWESAVRYVVRGCAMNQSR